MAKDAGRKTQINDEALFNEDISLVCTMYREAAKRIDPFQPKECSFNLLQNRDGKPPTPAKALARAKLNLAEYAGLDTGDIIRSLVLYDRGGVPIGQLHLKISSQWLRHVDTKALLGRNKKGRGALDDVDDGASDGGGLFGRPFSDTGSDTSGGSGMWSQYGSEYDSDHWSDAGGGSSRFGSRKSSVASGGGGGGGSSSHVWSRADTGLSAADPDTDEEMEIMERQRAAGLTDYTQLQPPTQTEAYAPRSMESLWQRGSRRSSVGSQSGKPKFPKRLSLSEAGFNFPKGDEDASMQGPAAQAAAVMKLNLPGSSTLAATPAPAPPPPPPPPPVIPSLPQLASPGSPGTSPTPQPASSSIYSAYLRSSSPNRLPPQQRTKRTLYRYSISKPSSHVTRPKSSRRSIRHQAATTSRLSPQRRRSNQSPPPQVLG